MRPYIYPNPENATLEELEQAIKASADRFMTRRLDTIRLLLKGNPYQLAVDYSLKSERTVRRWVAKWNESGIDGLASKPGRGRKPKINAAQGKIIGAVLEHPEDFGETHWTLVKLQGVIKRALAMEFGYSTFTRWVRRLGYRRLVPRPTAPDRDPTARQAFAQELSKIYQQDPESV
jgi:transposase